MRYKLTLTLLLTLYSSRACLGGLDFTCQGRCGAEKSIPCSCNIFCVLYNTCCENMAKDCPRVLQEGYAKFSSFLGASVVCGFEGVYKIGTATCSGRDASNSSLDIAAPSGGTTDIILNAPVTDSASSVTFLNREIYECSKDVLNTSSKLLPWGVRLLSSVDGTVYNETVSNRVQYEPNFNEDILSSHMCVQDVVKSCDYPSETTASMVEHYALYARKCKEFTGYVIHKNQHHKTVYQNRYCAYCRGIYEKDLDIAPYVKPTKHSLTLSVLVTFLGDENYVLEASSTHARLGQQGWYKLKCPNVENLIQTQSISYPAPERIIDNDGGEDSYFGCEAIECIPHKFRVHFDGVCKADYHIFIAFKDNEDGRPTLACPSAAGRIGQFITCSLSTTLRDGFWRHAEDFTLKNISLAKDPVDGEMFYSIDINFSSPNRVSERYSGTYSEDQISYIQSVANAVKAYRHFRLSHDICPSDSLSSESYTTSNFEELDFSNIPLRNRTLYGLIEDLNLAKMVEFRGEIIDNKTTTFLCLSRFRDVFEPLAIECLEDVRYAKDREFIESILHSPCVHQLLSADALIPPRTNGCQARQSCSKALVSVLIDILIILTPVLLTV